MQYEHLKTLVMYDFNFDAQYDELLRRYQDGMDDDGEEVDEDPREYDPEDDSKPTK